MELLSESTKPVAVHNLYGYPVTNLYLLSDPLPLEVTDVRIDIQSLDHGCCKGHREASGTWFEISVLRPRPSPDGQDSSLCPKDPCLNDDVREGPEKPEDDFLAQGWKFVPLPRGAVCRHAVLTSLARKDADEDQRRSPTPETTISACIYPNNVSEDWRHSRASLSFLISSLLEESDRLVIWAKSMFMNRVNYVKEVHILISSHGIPTYLVRSERKRRREERKELMHLAPGNEPVGDDTFTFGLPAEYRGVGPADELRQTPQKVSEGEWVVCDHDCRSFQSFFFENKYIALSYVWGDLGDTEQITLEHVYRYPGEEDGKPGLNDIKMKTYLDAANAMVDISRLVKERNDGKLEGYQLLQEHVDNMFDPTKSAHSDPGHLYCDNRRPLSAFFCDQWFRRVWVLQEVCRANANVIVTGPTNHPILFSDVILGYYYTVMKVQEAFIHRLPMSAPKLWLHLFEQMRKSSKRLEVEVFCDPNNKHNQLGQFRWRVLEPPQQASASEGQMNILTLFSEAMVFEATDPRDKLFAILSMAKDLSVPKSVDKPAQLRPDYTKPGCQV
ncbi:hypothetical protein G7Y89_g11373 [Cudoniella acicularis]|uniref:Heterokaryon incompatibility domain-containing protein n=1 Tax=Cudoniella acicularis TaxID=354080 RepID=A0A8H4RC33_9HELO|nr:hypothetical protein G7Y89_g11373 [Cudoniella acicularis]